MLTGMNKNDLKGLVQRSSLTDLMKSSERLTKSLWNHHKECRLWQPYFFPISKIHPTVCQQFLVLAVLSQTHKDFVSKLQLWFSSCLSVISSTGALLNSKTWELSRRLSSFSFTSSSLEFLYENVISVSLSFCFSKKFCGCFKRKDEQCFFFFFLIMEITWKNETNFSINETNTIRLHLCRTLLRPKLIVAIKPIFTEVF